MRGKERKHCQLMITGIIGTILLVPLLAVSSRASDYGEITVTVETILSSHSARGYDEYRATIINRSPSTTRRVAIILFAENWGSFLEEIRREVEIAPSSSFSVPLFAPFNHKGSGARVSIDGVRQKERVIIDETRTSAWTSRSHNNYFLLLSREIDKNNLMNSDPVTDGFKAAGTGESDVAYISYKSPPVEWSTHWIGYSGFGGVAITAEELSAMPDASRAALQSYVECGGVLIVVGRWPVPESWRARRGMFTEALNSEETGEGQPATINTNAPNNLEYYFAGFGKIVITGPLPLNQITSGQWQSIKLLMVDELAQKPMHVYISNLNRDFPVVDRIGVPVRGLFALMLAFVILIGPINLLWLARPGKKIRMLWTVPAISLLTCLIVAGFALYGEGVSSTLRIESFTILDETVHRATSLGWTGFYSPITPGEGLHFNYDTELFPEGPERWRDIGDRTIDFSSDQHLASGWITARVPLFFRFRKSEIRRERLTFRRSETGAPSVVNGLGARIQKLWLADRSGKIYSAEAIEPGAQAILSEAGLQAGNNTQILGELLTNPDWLEKFKYIEQNPAEYLMSGEYVAILETNPFVEEGLENVKTRKGRSFVYGVGVEAAK